MSSAKNEAAVDALSPDSSSASPAGSTLATSMSSASSNQGEEVSKATVCRWVGCSKSYEDPEDLYVHLCNDHVGRKSTNNLCLTCKWTDCDVTCAKRDHITSHLRVHTPLKPHACDSCGKLFKRPQDLKKHERIHTEQHQQNRQSNYQGSSLPMQYPASATNTNPLWTGARHSESQSSSLYHASSMQNASLQHTSHSSLYPSLPSVNRGSSMYTNNHHQGQVHRDHTPGYLHESASSTSLSPLSSHVATPASSGSPSAIGPLHHRYSNNGQASVDRGYLAMQNERPRGNNDDPNSYSYLAQGSSSMAGSKRGHDAVATASFFEDVRKKRVTPTYDSDMAERIEQSFGHGIDDASLHEILSSFATESAGTSDANSPAASHHSAQRQSSQGNHLPKLSLPDAFKHTDLAELNAFLMQVGANAARFDTSSSLSQGSQDPSSSFDFASALTSFGLTNVPGYEESLLHWPQDQENRHHSVPYLSGVDGSQWPSHSSAYDQRPIAQLPQRSNDLGYHQSSTQQQPQQQYQHSHQHSLQHSQQQQAALLYPPVPQMYHQGSSSASFDSVRSSRGPAYVPQLGPKEMSGSHYRNVEALTRAEPLQRSSLDSSLRSTHEKDQDDDEDQDMEDFVQSNSSKAAPPVVRSSVSIYPRFAISGDPARRLPSPTSNERGTGASSIASILNSPLSNHVRRSRSESYSMASSSPSPPASNMATNDGDSFRSNSSPFFPASNAGDGEDNMDDIEEEVATMEVSSHATTSHGSISNPVRQSHAKLILDLLMAINFPRSKRDATTTLAPLRIQAGRQQSDDDMEPVKTPTFNRASADDDEGSDETETLRSTPKMDGLRKLPNIASLLNEVDTTSEVKGAGRRRIMGVNI
ncbi:hypothetical protein CBS101457_000394 [Exobasidium rhododendri]|nr:hypothetical protein CBS101457_000394 [Exobasidium rhododendri]